MSEPAPTPKPEEPKAVYPSVTLSKQCPECPKCEEPKKKKKKPKGRPPILEVVSGVLLFVVIVFTTTKKIDKEREASQQKEYINVQDYEAPKSTPDPTPIKSEKIDISDFSDLEQQYINDNCKDKKGIFKEKCVRKSINELLDLY